jgi:hypothetical protein
MTKEMKKKSGAREVAASGDAGAACEFYRAREGSCRKGLPLVASYSMHVCGEDPIKCPVFRWALSLRARGVALPDRPDLSDRPEKCCPSPETGAGRLFEMA